MIAIERAIKSQRKGAFILLNNFAQQNIAQNTSCTQLKKTVIWGAQHLGEILYHNIKHYRDVLFFVDNNPSAVSPEKGKPVFNPSALLQNDFDLVYIASAAGLEAIYSQLVNELGIPRYKIVRLWGEANSLDTTLYRINFLEQFSEYAYAHGINGDVAEVGVFRGEFAEEINRVFSDRKLYLFDTFEGFNDRDLSTEKDINTFFQGLDSWIKNTQDFKNTSEEIVLNRMHYPEQCIIKKGRFPDTFDLADNNSFCFVNLDADLYEPIKAGLEVFYPRMSHGGVILIHDYYNSTHGAKLAVDEFINKYNYAAIPIGDWGSVAIIKN